MFMGHYAVALALKKTEPGASLGVLFIAVQLADFMFFPLAMIGVERASFIPGLTEASPLRLDFAPFSHGLIGALVASAIVYAAFIFVPVASTNKHKLGIVMGLAVFSHWLLDVITHTPDMPLVDGGLPKLGLGLWESAIGTFLVESFMVLVGLWLYLKVGGGTTRFTKYGMIGFAVFMVLVNVYNVFQPPPADVDIVQLGILALVTYSAFAAVAFWLEHKRLPDPRV